MDFDSLLQESTQTIVRCLNAAQDDVLKQCVKFLGITLDQALDRLVLEHYGHMQLQGPERSYFIVYDRVVEAYITPKYEYWLGEDMIFRVEAKLEEAGG